MDRDRPHYHQHRARLRRRLLEQGAGALAEYELLEVLLFGAMPRKDVKPLAKALIERFGSLAEVLAAEPAQLQSEDGVGEAVAASLKAAQAAGRLLAHRALQDRPVLSSWQALLDYCHAAMAWEGREEFRLIFLDRRNHLIADEVQQRGTVDQTAVYPREVVRRALDLNATALILVHNHPSGDPTPSRADIAMTKQVIAAAEPLGIVVHDHLVIGRDSHASFRSLGLL